MTKDELRLECLKLAHTHGRDPDQVIDRAEKYEAFVAGPSGAAMPSRAPLTLKSKT